MKETTNSNKFKIFNSRFSSHGSFLMITRKQNVDKCEIRIIVLSFKNEIAFLEFTNLVTKFNSNSKFCFHSQTKILKWEAETQT
jgi:hypothetical protein